MTDIERVVDWHIGRFPEAEMVHVALKLNEEAGEVGRAVNGLEGKNSATGGGDVIDECADVLISIYVLVGRWFTREELLEAVETKITMLETPGAHRASAL